MEYLKVLKTLNSLPFPIGFKNLACILRGEVNPSIKNNGLDKNEYFGCLKLEEKKISEIVDVLKVNNFLEVAPLNNNYFIKVLKITSLGKEELKKPTLKHSKFSYEEKETKIEEKYEKAFSGLNDFLGKYNDSQKLAIIHEQKNILCIAGAGSGKTTVLTKRIEFLTKFKGVRPDKILAITFTRKARDEMKHRLENLNVESVKVETFNSFCEKILRKYEDELYGKNIKVVTYKDKIKMINLALLYLKITRSSALNTYFKVNQRRGKTQEELFKIFLSDCFFVIDYFKYKNLAFNKSSFFVSQEYKNQTDLIYAVCSYIKDYMANKGLRDFTDQIVDTIKFFKKYELYVPEFEHVLIDEYQDINSSQIELIDLLKPNNLFVVGDPRQSIYGWRGSDIKYILNFENKYENTKVINLTKNYRSSMFIIDLINKQIKSMNLKDLEYSFEGKNNIEIKSFKTKEKELGFVSKKVSNLQEKTSSIFIISRTNYQLKEMEKYLKKQRVRFGKKTEFEDTSKGKKITLSTVHAIKGLEADCVFVIGCNTSNFPCIGSEHPIISLIKINEYNKEEEERRLLYVALSRAKDYLFITHTGKLTRYLDESKTDEKKVKNLVSEVMKDMNTDLLEELKEWRRNKAQRLGFRAYMILSNKALEGLSRVVPKSLEGLEEINGIGKVKVKRYGKELLQILERY